jgi:hypothetical protein
MLMKTMNRILLAAAVTVILGSMSQAMAQSQMSSPNGLAASPKVRQFLSERPAQLTVAPSALSVSAQSRHVSTLAGSPRAQQMARDNAKSEVAGGAQVVVASNQRTDDGIAASPKLREQMNERSMQFQIAPLK